MVSFKTQNFLRPFSKVVCLATFFLIFVGGLVTSTGSGLSVPDWPLSYGMFFPPMVGGVFFEHGHRMVASVVGFLMLCLCISLQFSSAVRWIKNLSLVALAAVIIQGLLGGLTVRMYLPPPVSISHGVLAQTFFVLTIILAYGLSIEREKRIGLSESFNSAFLRAIILLVVLVYLQLILGAVMRHTASGLAIPDFPKMGGEWLPRFDQHMLSWINARRFEMNLDPVTVSQVMIHFLHRANAFVLLSWVVYMNILAAGQYPLQHPVRQTLEIFDLVLLIQILLGIHVVWFEKEPYLTSIHVVVGAGILGLSILLALRAAPLTWAQFKHMTFGKINMKERSLLSAYLELTKPRILQLVLVTTSLGFFLGSGGNCSFLKLFFLLVGTGMVCSGSGTLNHYLERDSDSKMLRTQNRPLPIGQIPPGNALSMGTLLVLGGVFFLWWKINLLTAFLSLLTAFLYILVYTPMKKISWVNTTIGAIPGALPPLGGWAAATNNLSLGGWVLFLILFMWQHPHFYSIAWLYKEDYKRGGYKMLTSTDADGYNTFLQIIVFSLFLIPISLLPTWIGMSGWIYFYGTLILGLWILVAGLNLAQTKSMADAKKLLSASVIYLPGLFFLIIIDKIL